MREGASINPRLISLPVRRASQSFYSENTVNLLFAFLSTRIELSLFLLSKFKLALAVILKKITTIVCCHIISAANLCFHCKMQSLLSACVSRLLALAKTRRSLANCLLPMTKSQWGFGFLDQSALFSSFSTSPTVSFLSESQVSHSVTGDTKCCHFFARKQFLLE